MERILWSRHAEDGSGEEYRCKFKGALQGVLCACLVASKATCCTCWVRRMWMCCCGPCWHHPCQAQWAWRLDSGTVPFPAPCAGAAHAHPAAHRTPLLCRALVPPDRLAAVRRSSG